MGSPYVTFPGTSGRYAARAGGLALTGNIDLRWKVALTDWTPAAHNTILDTLAGNNGIRIRHLTGGQVDVIYGNGSSTREKVTAAVGLTDGEAHEFRWTANVTTGAVACLIDGASFYTSTMATGAGVPGVSTLYVAALGNNTFHLNGDLYYVEARDHTDTVVARFDAADVLEAVAA